MYGPKTCSASPKPHPSKLHPCNMPQANTEAALQFSESCAAAVALQHSLFCSADAVFTRSCAATSEKLRCNIENPALQESGPFLPLSFGFQAPTFRRPHLGPADLLFGLQPSWPLTGVIRALRARNPKKVEKKLPGPLGPGVRKG